MSHTAHTRCDSFRLSRKVSAPDLGLEKAAVLFNLGASHYASGCAAEKNPGADALKQACASFQAAAGVFGELRGVAPRGLAGVTVDLTPECAAALESLCLARAQEAFYEAAAVGGRSAALCSKLAAGAAGLYGDAMKAFGAPPLRDTLDKSWYPTVAVRAAMMHAKAAQHVAGGHAAAQSGAEKAQEAARLGSAVAALRNALRVARGVVPEPALGPVSGLEAQLKQKLTAAEKECDVVYMVRVPPHESLAPVAATLGVKATPLGPLIDASKETLLRTIVPDTAARAASKYSDLVDGLIRESSAQLTDASDTARTRLRELELPELLDALDRGGPVPGPLVEECADVWRQGGAQAIMQQLPRLQDMSRACAAALATAAATLAAAEEEALGGGPGSAGSAASSAGPGSPPADALIAGVREKIRGYEAALNGAQRSDGVLIARAQNEASRLSTLDPSKVASCAPRLMAPVTPVGSDAAAVPAVRATLAALEANAAERAGIEEELKELKRSDDILPRVMAAGGTDGTDAIFAAELQKYDAPKAAATANVAACTALLARLSAQHAAFTAAHDVAGYKQRLATYCGDLRDTLKSWRDLHNSIGEGLNFYTQLRAASAAVADEAAGVAGARRAAAEERVRDNVRREAQAAQVRADAERAAAVAAAEREQAAAARAQAEAQTAAWMAQQEHARQAQAHALAAQMQNQAALQAAQPPPAWSPAPPQQQAQPQMYWQQGGGAPGVPPPQQQPTVHVQYAMPPQQPSAAMHGYAPVPPPGAAYPPQQVWPQAPSAAPVYYPTMPGR